MKIIYQKKDNHKVIVEISCNRGIYLEYRVIHGNHGKAYFHIYEPACKVKYGHNYVGKVAKKRPCQGLRHNHKRKPYNPRIGDRHAGKSKVEQGRENKRKRYLKLPWDTAETKKWSCKHKCRYTSNYE